MNLTRCLFITAIALSSAIYAADVPARTKKADAKPSPADTSDLGPPFESLVAGISLRPPAGSNTIHRAVSEDEVAEFVNDQKHWTLQLSRVHTRQAVSLTKTTKPGLIPPLFFD